MRGLKEILVLDKVDDPNEKKEIRFTIEMKYNLLLGKPPGWGALPDWTVKPSDTALVHYGTAVKGGKPKGLVISHGNLISNVLQAEAVLGSLSKADVLLSAVPYFHLDVWTLINNVAIHKGAKSVTVLSTTLASFLDAVLKHQVTIARVSSALLTELAGVPKADLGSLKRIITDVSLDKTAEASLKKHYPKLAIESSYGAPTLIALEAKKEGVSLLPGTQAKIVDDAGKAIANEKEGTLLIKGDQVSAGYYHSEETTKARFDKEGFFNTLDRAKADKNGLLTITPKAGSDE
jgi:long-chain acyl-CoA synthetase